MPEISPRDLAQRLQLPEADRPALIDVRTPGEHRLAAIPGSVLVPIQELVQRIGELEPLRPRELVVYCHHGIRSESAAAYLRQLGFNACSLSGGIDHYSSTVDPSIPRY